MWTLLSFTGKFDVPYLEESIAKAERKRRAEGLPPGLAPGTRTEKQKQQTRDAQLARARVRRGATLERLQEKLSHSQRGRPLNRQQLQCLQEYQRGKLRLEANRLTLISGHGRLRREDQSFVDIGGSTGGFLRTVLDDWEPPELAEFEE